MLFLAEVITTSGFSRHLGLAYVCQKWHCSTYVHYFVRPRKHTCSVWKSTEWQISCCYLKTEVITGSGFGRDHDTILVIWCRHVPNVVFLFSLISCLHGHEFAHWVLEIVFHQPYSRKICAFHFGDRHLGFLADVDVTRYRKWHHWKVCPRKYPDSRWNFVVMSSTTRHMPGVKYRPLFAGKRR